MDEQPKTAETESDAGDEKESRTLQAWLAGIAIGCLVLAAMIAAYEIGFNSGEDSVVAQSPEPNAGKPASEPAAAGPGLTLFATNCGSCHTLAAADTSGTSGPNLDDLQPDAAMVAAAIENGGAGSGAMPPGLVSGEQTQQVADYVSTSAGSGN
jgi:mono/diheme cytochrome c family protein